MARRHSFFTDFQRIARAAARAQREAEAANRRRLRDQMRNQREALRLRQQQGKVERQQYLASRQSETDSLNAGLQTEVESLRSVLSRRRSVEAGAIIGPLKPRHDPPVLTVPPALAQPILAPTRDAFLALVKPLAWWEKLFGRPSRYERDVQAADSAFRDATIQHATHERDRQAELDIILANHAQALARYQAEYDAENQEFEDFAKALSSGNPIAVVTFFELTLNNSPYPDGFPQEFRIAYDPDARQLVLDYELPTAGVVPTIAEYRYVKTKDAVDEKPRKPAESKELYREVIAAVALRCLHECFAADGFGLIAVLTFNGFVHTLDPATGNEIRPYVISVRVTQERFAEIHLDRVDITACLRNLGAQVSPQPAELIAVKPIIEFDMVDKRFIGDQDVLSGLDARPNLMDLTPAEFEALVGNLFTRMGLETKLTRTSRDGGVDAVAFDTRPILGGKVVIQAKRYSHTVGVSAVRDLYGTMMNEGANKGILVTTSSYGPDAYDFCTDKPIELIDGSALLYHLDQVGVQARIIFPTDQAAAV